MAALTTTALDDTTALDEMYGPGSGQYAASPLTSEPPLAEDVPLTSEPPLAAEPALTSEPTAACR